MFANWGINDLYREDIQPVMDLTKGAEMLYEVQFVSFQSYYYFCITFTYTSNFKLFDLL